MPILFLHAGSSRSLVYQGRSLNHWLSDLGDSNWAVRKRAERAVAHFGPAAVPQVTELLRAHQGQSKLPLPAWAAEWDCLRPYVLSADDLQHRGLRACAILGPAVRELLPDVIRLLRERPSDDVATALEAFGPNATPGLTEGLSAANEEVRVWSALALGRVYFREKRFRPSIGAKEAAAPSGQLGARLEPDLGRTIEALEENLRHSEPRVRAAAIWALGKIGKVAAPSMPEIVKLLDDPSAFVHRVAVESIRQLQAQITPPGMSADTDLLPR